MEIKKVNRPSTVLEFLTDLPTLELQGNTHHFAPSRTDAQPSVSRRKQVPAQSDNSQISVNEEETALLQNSSIPKAALKNTGKEIIDGLDFVDLGLSVKWATANIMAKSPESPCQFFSRKDDNGMLEIFHYNMLDATVPTIEHFKELIFYCSWQWSELNGTLGYTVSGMNGNSIFLPVTGDGLQYPGKNQNTFGLLWTNEALLNQWRNESMLLYYNPNIFKLSTYSTNKSCPVRLVLK